MTNGNAFFTSPWSSGICTTIESVFKMADNDFTHLTALGKEAAAGDDVAFMDIVKEFPCIYNRGSVQFKDRNVKMNAWRRIGKLVMANDNVEMANEETLQLHITASKQRYENIRTLLSRYLKKIKPPSGSGSDQVIIDQRYEHLRWLITFIRTRSTTGNNMSLQRRISTIASGGQEQTYNDQEEDLEPELIPDCEAVVEERPFNEYDSSPLESQAQESSNPR